MLWGRSSCNDQIHTNPSHEPEHKWGWGKVKKHKVVIALSWAQGIRYMLVKAGSLAAYIDLLSMTRLPHVSPTASLLFWYEMHVSAVVEDHLYTSVISKL